MANEGEWIELTSGEAIYVDASICDAFDDNELEEILSDEVATDLNDDLPF